MGPRSSRRCRAAAAYRLRSSGIRAPQADFPALTGGSPSLGLAPSPGASCVKARPTQIPLSAFRKPNANLSQTKLHH